ncbi:MAG: class I SAM-dependent rRNA methyltransferase [Acidobacteriota bacterium]
MNPYGIGRRVRLKPGREVSLARLHPWVYRGALGAVQGASGAVEVLGADGMRLGVALAGEPGASLALRMVTWGDEVWSRETLRFRLASASALRRRLPLDAEAFRLVNAEGDGLPGLVIDRYGPWAVIEPFMTAWEDYLSDVVAFLRDAEGVAGVLVRRGKRVNVALGELPAAPVAVREGPWVLLADLVGGQKTGLFLDQRDNRRRVFELARDCRVLNLFSYSGGFGVAALAGGARRVVNVDASAAALELAKKTWQVNGFAVEEGDFVRGDAFRLAAELHAAGERFELVIVDPPAFVSHRSRLAEGLRGYREINRQALRLTSAGALLLTCSCSALVSEQLFAEVLLTAALDVGRRLTVLGRWGAGPDHPVSLYCPETRHLKAWLCSVE